jgi:hypothetical protein
MPRRSSEYENFDRAMKELIKVSHSELKTKLDAEKKSKERKKRKKEPKK